jgi:hypothetical protein
VSTESDPDAFIQNSVNVVNGYYCESATDLVITGPAASAFDHEFMSPTYQRELRKHITNYIKTNGKML